MSVVGPHRLSKYVQMLEGKNIQMLNRHHEADTIDVRRSQLKDAIKTTAAKIIEHEPRHKRNGWFDKDYQTATIG